jgi:hypothetical protein
MWPTNTEFAPIYDNYQQTFTAFPLNWAGFYVRCLETRYTLEGPGQITVDTVLHGPPETVVSKDVELVDLALIAARVRGRTDAQGRHVFTGLPLGRTYLAVGYDENGEFNPPAALVTTVSTPAEPLPEEPA